MQPLPGILRSGLIKIFRSISISFLVQLGVCVYNPAGLETNIETMLVSVTKEEVVSLYLLHKLFMWLRGLIYLSFVSFCILHVI